MKVGIITHYYDSTNFGGNLQAYALCTYLNSLGISSEQISLNFRAHPDDTPVSSTKRTLLQKIFSKRFFPILISKIHRRFRKMWESRQEKRHGISRRRRDAFENFNKAQIPHSERVYDKYTVSECVDDYDAFITGSDQVWNLSYYLGAFFLSFVPSDKKKLSYAASISMKSLSDRQKEIFKKHLSDFSAISVREKSAIDLINDLTDVDVKDVLDPVFLLDSTEWDKAASERIIEGDYVFCYFLGEEKKLRKLAERFAKEKGLRLVTVPHAGGWLKPVDSKFGDIKLYDASPNDFISLIKHAKYVLTDSFHAVVFSHIYQKQFFVFNRSADGSMSSRIIDVTKMLGCEDRYCREKQNLCVEHLSSLPDIDYTESIPEFEAQRQKSIAFLKNSLEIN